MGDVGIYQMPTSIVTMETVGCDVTALNHAPSLKKGSGVTGVLLPRISVVDIIQDSFSGRHVSEYKHPPAYVTVTYGNFSLK
jgi:hypothetical protein